MERTARAIFQLQLLPKCSKVLPHTFREGTFSYNLFGGIIFFLMSFDEKKFFLRGYICQTRKKFPIFFSQSCSFMCSLSLFQKSSFSSLKWASYGGSKNDPDYLWPSADPIVPRSLFPSFSYFIFFFFLFIFSTVLLDIG